MRNQYLTQCPPVLSVRDQMAFLQLAPSSFVKLNKDKSFSLALIGNQRFVLRDSLPEWMKAHEQPRLAKGGVAA